ncbi:ribosome biogenesis GTP-binding protein YihA/YsxC [Entomospira nematocerorum]|uniref:Probable GTP-binding protein EngB n=1 Tax=Entomospira nematocerorum TaxID=2719987 RepID=A0A968KXG4_9SPIO|nr:ribosome biogenesis GTP-binding protein YihA/YsxC [Entomospira nematocera]NIZ46547.1 ribosome biogenesis GTP-binding protein YsxC [Entomospira nematocera]WDI33654.1 ribosome biogenesis GTP-binding protein YihA/YsxC [Entomospira nematocera]
MEVPFRILFNKTLFAQGAPLYEQLPEDDLIELAIAGRSNAGKSTLINNLTQQNKLARVSQTPGKTREINLFHLFSNQHTAPIARLVDLPGYGYAKVGKALKISWQHELTTYLTQRQQLKLLLIILDSRMPPTDLDLQLIQMSAIRGLQQIFIFNKVDKLNQSGKAKLKTIAEKMSYDTPNTSFIFYSSPKNIGKEILTKQLSEITAQYLIHKEETDLP